MSLRLRLIIAFFLLAVVPLAAVTLYAYTSNARALRDAAEREADLLAGELSQRMQLVTAQLTERVEHVMDIAELQDAVDRVSAAAAASAPAEAEPAPTIAAVQVSLNDQVARSIGDAAVLLDNVDLRGLRGRGGRRPPGNQTPTGEAAAARPDRPTSTRTPPARAGEPPPNPQQATPPDPTAAVVTAVTEPLRIDLGPIRRELIREIVPGGRFEDLTPEERQKLGTEINLRLLGIQQGLQLGARALQERAEVARLQAEEAALAAQPPAQAPPPSSTPAPPPAPPAPPQVPAVALVRTSEVSGNRLDVRVERNGEIVRQVNAEINVPNLLATVFSTTRRDRGEVPFAFAADGELYTPNAEDRLVVEELGESLPTSGPAVVRMRDWVVVTTSDPSGSGLTLGIARPVGDSLADLRRTAARNAGLGMLFIGLAIVGIVPLSGRLTRTLSVLSDGVRRIAQGDYRARVTVNTTDEIGELATAFNKMAEDVERHQRSAIEQERLKRELELGRQIQHEMLPHGPLRLGPTEIMGVSVPAREVGGDFFNYFSLPSGHIALLVGDVSGKGVGAALLMANIQASLRTRLGMGQGLAVLADELDREIEAGSPGPVYSTLFVAILDPVTRELRYVNAGHNPQYVLRAGSGLDRMPATGLPVGLLAGRGYVEERLQLAEGDVLFFYTDGCVEVENEAGDMLGPERFEALVLESMPSGPEEVLVRIETTISEFRGSQELFDDATMMAVRVG